MQIFSLSMKKKSTTSEQPKSANFSSNPNIASRTKSQLLWSEVLNLVAFDRQNSTAFMQLIYCEVCLE